MNTVRSVGYGWGILIVAGGGAYFFAKRSVNSDRAERAATQERSRQAAERMRQQEYAQMAANTKRQAGNTLPSQGAGGEAAPVTDDQEAIARRGKYEAAEPFRARKGDRFS